MQKLHNCLQLIAATALGLGAAAVPACAAETDPDGALYQLSDDALADVQQALELARADDRLALVVLGANWCHDSRALAARLQRAPLKDVIDKNYELVFVSVGYLDRGREVVQEFGVPHYYATPTVLVVDPSTGQLVNAEDRHQWGNAYNIGMSDSVAYFEKWPNSDQPVDTATSNVELQQLFEDIDAFEHRLADRVAAGYVIVGPMLQALKDGNKPETFDARWDELRDFRVAVPKHTGKLRKEARDRVSAGEDDVEIQYPSLPPMSWESGD